MRFNLTRLEPADVQDLRDAYAAMYEISEIAVGDNRGFMAYARGHGYDQDLCHRDNRIFLTWHRAYIYAFEKALNSALQWKRGDDQLKLTLPYWDWTTQTSGDHASNGIPKIVNDATYKNASGDTVENPLARAKSLYRSVSQGLSGEEEFTQRFPGRLSSQIPLFRNEVARYLENPSFEQFSNDLNFGAHGAVHVSVGGVDSGQSPLPGGIGDMRSTVSASYDPIFWLHHSMVDKVWYDWQVRRPNAIVPNHVLDEPVYGGRPGREYIDTENSLRYIYSADSVETVTASSGTIAAEGVGEEDSVLGAELLAEASSDTNREISVGTVTAPFERAQLDFLRMRPPTESFEIRAFIDNPEASSETDYDDPSYGGRLVLFGHGECHGAPGHCCPGGAKRDEYDLRPKHSLRFEHTRFCLDLTRGLRRFMGRKKSANRVKIYLVTVDGEGKAVPANSLEFEGCSLRTFA